jgi:hypothetical protein
MNSNPLRPLVLVTVLSLGAAVIFRSPLTQAQASNADAQAMVRFNRGRELFLARNFEAALAEFRAAVTLIGSPNTRLYIARCLRELGRNAEASVEFQRAAAEASDRIATEPRYAATRDTARTEGAQVQALIGRLTVRVPHPPEGVTVTVGGATLASGGWDVPTPTDPRAVEIAASAPGRLPFHQSVRVVAGRDTDVTVELAIDPNAQVARATTTTNTTTSGTVSTSTANESGTPPSSAATTQETTGGGLRYVGVAVAAVGLIAGGLFVYWGSLAQNRFYDLQMICGGHACGPAYEPQIAEGERYALQANVMLTVGVVALGAGVVMMLVGGPSEVVHASNGSTPSARAPRPSRLSFWAHATDANGGLIGLRGSF